MDNLFDVITFYFYYWSSLFIDFPVIIRVAIFFIIALGLLYIYSLFRIFLMMYIFKQKKKMFERMGILYNEKMKEILLSTHNILVDDIKQKLALESKKLGKWEKIQITEHLLSIKSANKATININNYLEIIEAFTLVSFWEKLLHTKSLKKNMQALRKLDNLGINIPSNVLVDKIQGINPNLRKYAKSEYLRFAKHDPFKFLEEDFDRDLNPLDQIRIHASLKERAKIKSLPLLMRWVLTAENEDYKCFLIKEIGLFNQIESAHQLLDLYQTTSNNRVKAKIAETLGVLKYTLALRVLTTNFNSTPEFVQLSIINAMGMFATPEALKFLESLFNEISDDELFIRVVYNIYLIDNRQETYLKLKDVTTNVFRKSAFSYAEKEETIKSII